MAFEVTAEAYGRFMGRYSEQLAVLFADYAGVTGGQRALDVGCGPGALTAQLVSRLGAPAVQAIDPSQRFVDAALERCPSVEVRRGVAEQLPYPDDSFDVVLAQLVVHFLRDPVAGLQQLWRVAKPDGVVAACVWDHAGGHGPLSTFWEVVHELDPNVGDESELPGVREGDLVALFHQAGLANVDDAQLTVTVDYDSFDDWWEPYTLGVGPAGDYLNRLPAAEVERIRSTCSTRLPASKFTVEAKAWTARARR